MDGLLRQLIKTVRRRLRSDEEVTVEAVTKELGYTRQYVSGRFHRVTGRRPGLDGRSHPRGGTGQNSHP